MVLGLLEEAASDVQDTVTGAESEELGGFASTLINSDLTQQTSNFDSGEYNTASYYRVEDQEQVTWGAKDSASDETGKVVCMPRDVDGNKIEGKVRFSYTTRAGRSRDVVFEESVDRLDQDDHEDLRGLAPKHWGAGGAEPPSGRGSPARAVASDRLAIEVKPESDTEYDQSESDFRIPITFQQE